MVTETNKPFPVDIGTKKPKKKIAWTPILGVAVIILAVATTIQGIQIAELNSGSGATGSGSVVTGGVASTDQILAEITPTGTPDYGADVGASYDDVEDSLTTLAGYEESISLSGAGKQRYIKIATTPGNACEYCCGLGSDKGFGTTEGKIACGCSHNVAFGGLTKWLIKNSDYSDEQINTEIQKWKVLFFPRDAVKKEMQKRGVTGQAALPGMVGGC